MRVPLFRLMGERPVLAGSQTGRKAFEALWTATSAPSALLVLLDFSGVEIATSSFLREAVVVFKRRLREDRPYQYLALLNISSEIEEELVGLLRQMGEALWVYDRGTNDSPRRRLLGKLDQKLGEALELVETRGEVDAGTLWKDTQATESIGVTAWNNRLANLARYGLVLEVRRGKQKLYRSLHFEVG